MMVNKLKLDTDLLLWCLLDPSAAGEYPRDFLGISLQEQPNKYYLIVRGQKIVLEADSSIQMIMEKLQSYKLRVSLNFEVKIMKMFAPFLLYT